MTLPTYPYLYEKDTITCARTGTLQVQVLTPDQPVHRIVTDLCHLTSVSLQSRKIRDIYGRCRSGNREVVGFGINGTNAYKDDSAFPFPAIRFKENTFDLVAIKEREKCDWRVLCCEEKKALYRMSFCQTFAEFQHNTGTWKLILGTVLFLTSLGFWCMMFSHYYIYEPLPISLSTMSQKAQLRRMIELRVNPVDGITSHWDYDYDRWKWQTEAIERERLRLKNLPTS
ncbi:cytochrome c oxidase subunit 4 isoform 1, mitochondrial-like isoform X1 [Hyposmocoma kahamanoa]|uniref:cytochrome c oxidase subunit 4 isoform 1, mitochondrial-like isoform X1 n=1 Tax=Hyposmocoma kahamanoa TaxID=1477025 RepID=UPI000E6D7AF1|nr:cytochrome c oxidase subunit 4 isoform 1, mitochondrial-like isoform X1 [Hyposmocoma kahamanoa]